MGQVYIIWGRDVNEEIRRAVEWAYAQIGEKGSAPPKGMNFDTGARLALTLGYPEDILMKMSARALDSFVGAAPLPAEVIGSGEGGLVLDCGAGAGVDAFWLAASGLPVLALDSGAAMIGRLTRAARFMAPELKAPVHPILARLPYLPVADGAASWALFNGVANLVPERDELLREVFRALKPGGRLLVADIIALEEIGDEIVASPEAWAWCVGGAETADTWLARLGEAGFGECEVTLLETFAPLARGVIRAVKP